MPETTISRLHLQSRVQGQLSQPGDGPNIKPTSNQYKNEYRAPLGKNETGENGVNRENLGKKKGRKKERTEETEAGTGMEW